MDTTIDHGQVAALTPGRVRIRLHRPHRHLTERVKSHLEVQAGVRAVESNPLTGSVLVRYDHRTVTCDEVLGLCRDVGIFVSSVVEAEGEPLLSGLGGSSTADAIIGAIEDLDRRLSQITGRAVDLKLVVPAGLAAFGVRQLIVEGLAGASGYILVWLAVETFFKLNRRPSGVRAQLRDHAREPSAA